MRLQKLNAGTISAGSTLQVSKALHDGKTILLDTLTGSTVTLPPATGSYAKYKFFESLAATSNSHIIKVQNSTDVIQGTIAVAATAGGTAFPTTSTSDTVTLNRTTTGGATRGATIEFEDVAAGLWSVKGYTNGSGTVATPFSATV